MQQALPDSCRTERTWPRRAAPAAAGLSLSLRLRAGTAAAHRLVEARTGLPDAIASRDDYIACLRRFHSLYRPLEAGLATFSEWRRWGIELAERGHAPRLGADLDRLGAQPAGEAPGAAVPALGSFAKALGALYVLEGSTLGGQLILRRLVEAGIGCAGEAHAFFGGRGAATGPLWQAFRLAVDRYGEAHPEQADRVIDGAERTFLAIGRWMDAGRWRRT